MAVLIKKVPRRRILKREGGSRRGERRRIAKIANARSQITPAVRKARRGLGDQKLRLWRIGGKIDTQGVLQSSPCDHYSLCATRLKMR